MNIVLWILQLFLGSIFIWFGANHFILPAEFPRWFHAIPMWLHYFTGTAEILGGLGLILPGIFKIQTRLTPLAAAGLVLVMIGALAWQVQRGAPDIFQPIIGATLCGIVAYGRWRLWPLQDRRAAS